MKHIFILLLALLVGAQAYGLTMPDWAQIKNKPELYNIVTYGAIADDGNDDTAAIQSAIDDAAGNGIVYIPSGTFHAEDVELASRTYIIGNGAASIIKRYACTGGHYAIFSINARLGAAVTENVTDVAIFNIKLDGSGWGYAGNTECHSLDFNGVSNLTIRDVFFYGFASDGCYIGVPAGAGMYYNAHNYNVVIENCVFDGIDHDNRNAITILDCDGLWIKNNVFKRCTTSGQPGPIDIETESIMDDPTNRNFWICDNTFEDFGGDAAISLVIKDQDILTSPPRNFTIAGNKVKSVKSGADPWGVNVYITDETATNVPDSSTPKHNILINNNNFLAGGLVRYANEITIKDNTYASSTRPLTIENSRIVRIEGNTFDRLGEGSPSNSLLFNGVNSKIDVVANVFGPVDSSYPAIRIGDTEAEADSIDGFKLIGNTFDESYSFSLYQTYASATWLYPHRNIVRDNNFNNRAFSRYAIFIENMGTLLPYDFTVSPSDCLVDTFNAPGPVNFGRLLTERLNTDTAFYTGAPEGTTVQTFWPHQNVGTFSYTVYTRMSLASDTWGDWFVATGTVVTP